MDSSGSTLADIFAGALGGYVDSQNNQPISAIALTPQTAYGYAGYAQATPGTVPTTASALGSNSTLVILGVAVLAAVLLLRK